MSALPLSPCVQICLLDPLDQICLGCGRHIDEIAQWANLSALQRQAILNRLNGPERANEPAPSAQKPDQPTS